MGCRCLLVCLTWQRWVSAAAAAVVVQGLLLLLSLFFPLALFDEERRLKASLAALVSRGVIFTAQRALRVAAVIVRRVLGTTVFALFLVGGRAHVRAMTDPAAGSAHFDFFLVEVVAVLGASVVDVEGYIWAFKDDDG